MDKPLQLLPWYLMYAFPKAQMAPHCCKRYIHVICTPTAFPQAEDLGGTLCDVFPQHLAWCLSTKRNSDNIKQIHFFFFLRVKEGLLDEMTKRWVGEIARWNWDVYSRTKALLDPKVGDTLMILRTWRKAGMQGREKERDEATGKIMKGFIGQDFIYFILFHETLDFIS